MLFWTRRTYCFLLCLSSNLAGVLPFRNRALGGVSAAESPIRSWTAKLLASIYPIHPSLPQHFALSWFGGAERPIWAIVQARLRHVCGLRTGALFFFLGGSKGAVLDPPNVLFFAVPELESCWGSAVSEPCPRRCFCSRISYGAGRQSFYTASIHLSPTLCF